MIQTGTLYTVDSTGTPTGVPIKGATIVFKQNNSVIKTAQTDVENGEYTIDLELGKYLVEVAKGNITIAMRAGQLFDLKDSDGSDTFQRWLYSKSGDIDDQLLNFFKEIADQANASAESASQSANKAKDIADSINIKITQKVADNDDQIASSGAVLRALNLKQDQLDFIGSGKTVNESELIKKQNKLEFIGTGKTVNESELKLKRDITNVLFPQSGINIGVQGWATNIQDGNQWSGYNFALVHTSEGSQTGAHTILKNEYGTFSTREWTNAQLSDMRAKRDIRTISDLELEAMSKIDFQAFKYREDQSYTNSAESIFFGVIAQKVMKAFKDVGLSAFDYNIVVDLRGRQPISVQGDTLSATYGVSYIGLLILEAEINRRIRNNFEVRLAALELAIGV